MGEQIRVLAVDDEAGIRFFLEEVLRKAGYAVATAASGEEALERLREEFFDVLFLDLQLGGQVDGLRVLEAVRWRWPETIVIILTAHASLESALVAIREDVAAYLRKPVEAEEIRRTMLEVLNRQAQCQGLEGDSAANGAVLTAGELVIDLQKHQATLENRSLDLTPHEFNLLVYLAQHTGHVATPKELVQATLGYSPEDQWEARQSIKWYIHRLRRKVEPDPSQPRYILNVRGVGYYLDL